MNTKKLSIVGACLLTLGFASAQAASTIETAADDQELHLAAAWTGGVVPTTGDTGIINNSNTRVTDTGAFLADLELVSGGSLTLFGASLTMGADFTLDGGAISLRNGRHLDLGGKNFFLNSGSISQQNSADVTIQNGKFQGSGLINLVEVDTPVNGSLVFASSVDTSGFTGTFNLQSGKFALAEITTDDASFDLTISGTGVYENTASVAFTSLTIDGNAVAADTYTRAALLTYGTTEYGADWSGFIADGGASITVIPEPGTCALIGGLLALTSVMIRRRR